MACSAYNPAMQSILLEASIAGGGPRLVDLAGWMCGRAPYGGYVRIVFVRYPPGAEGRETLIPAIFEDGLLVAFGWYLLEAEPNRYGTVVLPTRAYPWEIPKGWSAARLEPMDPTRVGNNDPLVTSKESVP